jgi:ectoine hydroxylase-related dioxygenase (phytanoyl-CoA dioxygenase family)
MRRVVRPPNSEADAIRAAATRWHHEYMAYQVSPAQRASYRERGAAHLPAVVAPEWVARLRAAFDEVMAASADPGWVAPQSGTQNPLTIVRGASDVMATNMVPTHTSFGGFVAESGIADAVAALIGSETLRFWIDATFEKRGPAGGSATAWHHDICTWPFWGEHMPIVWVPLTDVGPDDTPLITLDGSHAAGTRYHSPFSRQDVALRAPYRPWSELTAMAESDAPRSTWPMPAGDILVMHPATVHASAAWPEGRHGRRLAISLRFLGDDVIWAPDEFAVPIPKLDTHPSMTHGAPPPADLFPPLRLNA